MFATYTLTSNILRGAHQYSKFSIRHIGAIRNSVTFSNRNLFLKTQPKVSAASIQSPIYTKLIDPTDSLLQTNPNSILHRFCSTGPKAEPVKSKKIVGYWLLGCSGMVFTAVVLGGTFVYVALLLSICTILEKYLVHTTKWLNWLCPMCGNECLFSFCTSRPNRMNFFP